MADAFDRTVNHPESNKDVVETKAAVIVAFLNDVIRKEMPNCAFAYDPDLSYESGMRILRDNNNSGQQVQDGSELFLYRVTSLRHPDQAQAPNIRSAQNKGRVMLPDGKAAAYTAVHAEFDIEWLYCIPSMENAQRFEVAYLSDDGFSGSPELTANMGELGEFKYFIEYEKLLDFTANSNDNYYKSYASSIRVRGFFFVFRGESKIITEIKSKINAYTRVKGDGQLLETLIVK